jgi:autophagy-related protein 33
MSYTFATTGVPQLTALPDPGPTQSTIDTLATTNSMHENVLAGVSSAALLLAYALSPRGARHPYLVWACALTGAGVVVPRVLLRSMKTDRLARPGLAGAGGKQPRAKTGKTMDASYEVVGDSHSEGNSEPEDEPNGETVSLTLRNFSLAQTLRTVFAGTAFAVSVIGLWGDGF